ncbi:hypothetical protein [Plectonema phage JingP1]|uniref:Uncharacterized protein n=1 Tax=Plectonema phage JingP1 TaxID=2961687 RepID=A0A9E7NQA3_9CAUD|nr:hypothetical protein [Plectonema phage JingP1]
MHISLSNWLRNVVAPSLIGVSAMFASPDVPLRTKLSPTQIQSFTQTYPYAEACLDSVYMPHNASSIEGDTRNALDTCITSHQVRQLEGLRQIWGVK